MSKCVEFNGEDYPYVHVNGKQFFVHRLVAMLFHGLYLQDTKTFVCHRCDNPKCINPEHLFLGTQKDNIDDMISKGRRGNPHAPGEKNGNAKLTEEQVKEIRTRRSAGWTYVALADKYGISARAVSDACRRLCWAHVD